MSNELPYRVGRLADITPQMGTQLRRYRYRRPLEEVRMLLKARDGHRACWLARLRHLCDVIASTTSSRAAGRNCRAGGLNPGGAVALHAEPFVAQRQR